MADLKNRLFNYLDENKERFMELGDKLFSIPELGYREYKTKRFVKESLEALGINVSEGAVTGLKGVLNGKESKMTIGVLGELDALYFPQHESADSATGASHVCGHHMQTATMLAVAEALVNTGIYKELPANITFFGTPAEERIDTEYREQLLSRGAIEYASGKQEMLAKGFFDEVDVVIATHAIAGELPGGYKSIVSVSNNGFDSIRFHFKGKASHAGVAPQGGINALQALNLSVAGIQALRETFPDNEGVRVNYIIIDGGKSLGTIPQDAVLEVQIRGGTPETINGVLKKVIRACEGGAHIIGCQLEHKVIKGYAPFNSDPELNRISTKNIEHLLGKGSVWVQEHGFQCTDLGDVSQKIKTAQLNFCGFGGALHSSDFCVSDKYAAYVIPAKALCGIIIDLVTELDYNN